MATLPEKFAFLLSNRFIAIIIGALSIYLKAKGIFGDPEMVLVSTITAAFIAVRTVDRATEVLSKRSLPVDDADAPAVVPAEIV